eukprot:TRINITY_DN12535_c0_g2_i3.p1 TRINITY_DN12535_c0_g2~~TRINITY_DN12535_c0_g2_i3.p1  ORF type:complete len:248 (+),score=48.85 TRINITY_DN12535_c0_g2_i3:65-808(+)
MRHLVFVCHGLLGMNATLHKFEAALNQALGDDYKAVLLCHSWGYTETLYGIDHLGRMAADEILSTCAQHDVWSISLIGISLGGLVLRRAATLLYMAKNIPGSSNSIVFEHYTSLGSPHMGVADDAGVFTRFACRWLLGQTGLDLTDPAFLHDAMVTKDDLLAMSAFKTRTAVCNEVSDVRVGYWSSSLGKMGDYTGPFNPVAALDWRIIPTGFNSFFSHSIVSMNSFFIAQWTPLLDKIIESWDIAK